MQMGLDPSMGVLHVDQPARDSLALDLMEPVRPEVDTYVLDLLHRQAFLPDDFFETRSLIRRGLKVPHPRHCDELIRVSKVPDGAGA